MWGMRGLDEALLLQSQVAGLHRPQHRVLKHFRDWFSGEMRSHKKPIIAGKARRMLDDKDDLVALKVAADPDLLSHLVQDHWFLAVSVPSVSIPLGQNIKQRGIRGS